MQIYKIYIICIILFFFYFFFNEKKEYFGKDRGGEKKDDFKCNNGYYITEISGKSGKYLDSFKFKCSDDTTSNSYGGSGGGDYSVKCKTGFNSISVKHGQWIDALNAPTECAKISNISSSPELTGNISTNSDGEYQKCDDNQRIIGFKNIRAGSYINYFEKLRLSNLFIRLIRNLFKL